MATFANDMNISRIKMCHSIQCFCTIGKTLCTYELGVELEPAEYIPDYLEVQESLDELNNHWYTLEGACAEVFSRVAATVLHSYKYLRVSVECHDARHFPAIVEKEHRAL